MIGKNRMKDWKAAMSKSETIDYAVRIANTGVPARHAQIAAVDLVLDGKRKDAFAALRSNMGTGMLFALIGRRGTGKTQLAVALVKESCYNNISAKYTVTMDFFMAIKATYATNATRNEYEVLNTFATPQLLILDEVHERGETDWENRLLTHMLDKRYGARKDTILISNQTFGVFQKAIGTSIISRLQETGAIIECDWPSFRVAK